ncbi:site-specific DNA-methyltransferase [Mesorhizobium sediminum]|nr:site-specific DNA-methyltransferase [Mesorhizobium sediminum]
MAKRFGKRGSAPAKAGSDGRFTRQSKGFMGRVWDAADESGYRIAHDPEFWSLVYDLLLPGGYCLAFSSPRTGHWQAAAMELAGFIMHPFTGWVYGSGFPKAHSVTRLARKAGVPEAELIAWEGWYYGTQSTKPAIEPVYIGQKPFDTKTGFRNVLTHGVGALNIKKCLVPTEDDLNGGAYAKSGQARDDEWGENNSFRRDQGLEFVQPEGRWPANLLHDGSDDVVGLFPASKGQKGDVKGNEPSGVTNGIYNEFKGRVPSARRSDAGSAARFFNCFPPDIDAITYHGKAKKADRDGSSHPTVKPVGLLRHFVRLTTPAGGTVLDAFAGSGTTGAAALAEGMNALLVEREPDHADDIRRRFKLPMVDPSIADEYLRAIISTFASQDSSELI